MTEVTIYSSMLCPFCTRAKRLLKEKEVPFTEIDLMQHPLRKREMVEKAGGLTSVPQIFIGETHIGGCDELYALEAEGKLDPLLEGQAA
ncbi:MAG: glutaredoxin 3 [Rhodovibrionaceae bacterium]